MHDTVSNVCVCECVGGWRGGGGSVPCDTVSNVPLGTKALGGKLAIGGVCVYVCVCV